MLRRLWVVIGLGAMAVGPAMPDLVNVTAVDSSVSGSGYVAYFCGITTPGCTYYPGIGYMLNVPYSFSGVNSGFGSAESPPWGPVSGYAGVNTTTTADSLAIMLMGGHSDYAAPFYGNTENASVSVSFDLTEQSLIQLTGYPDPNVTAELLDSNGNVILALPFPSSPTLLLPGSYLLDASAASNTFGAFGGQISVIDFNENLTANFTPVPVPEPRFAFLATLLATMLGGFAASRRRRVS